MASLYEGSHQQHGVVRDDDVMVPMRDGVSLATDIYFPAYQWTKGRGQVPGPPRAHPLQQATARQCHRRQVLRA